MVGAYVFVALALFASAEASQVSCGSRGQACCETGPSCQGELGCSGGTCRDIDSDMVAYANYCKQELGFTDPKAKLPYVSCFDSGQVGSARRTETGRQAQIQLTLKDAAGPRTLYLRDNAGPVKDGKDIWDLVQTHGCDNPNYLHESCDPYYRLNVWRPDAANNQIVAALHCRSSDGKPSPSGAIQAKARLEAFLAANGAPSRERERLFRQWNDSSEIVLILSNLTSGKTCFFHAASPYYGSRIPAPDDESEISTEEAARKIWEELPVKPPEGPSLYRGEWLRNGRNAWQSPMFMNCTHCHDNGPFMHNPFIDSMNENGTAYLPTDRKNRPYLPLGSKQKTGYNSYFIKTDPVRTATGVEPQLCTKCHSIGNQSGSHSWLVWATGQVLPQRASSAAKTIENLRRYMPPGGASSIEEYYADNGAHIDAIQCCAQNPSWSGCYKVDRANPTSQGTPGTDSRSCTASSCGGWNQPCCPGQSCNHQGLACSAQGSSATCKFKDELR